MAICKIPAARERLIKTKYMCCDLAQACTGSIVFLAKFLNFTADRSFVSTAPYSCLFIKSQALEHCNKI